MKNRWLFAVAALALAGNGESISEDMREAYRLMAIAREAARDDRNREAAALFADLIAKYPSLRQELLREYADQLLYAGKVPDSIPLFRETLRLPSLTELDMNRTHRSLALALLWSGRHEEAVSAYRAALRLMPGDADLDRNYVDALVGAARDAARLDRNKHAGDRFEEAIERAPARRREFLREYADQLTYSGRAADAVPLFREVLEIPDLPENDEIAARRNLALALQWSGQHEAAIRAYDKALARIPGDVDLRKNRVDAVIGAARKAAARDSNALAAKRFAEALRAAPERRRELLREYADQLTYAGNPAAAVNLYRELIASELTARAVPSLDLLKALGLAHLWAGQYAAAKATYEQALALGGDDIDTQRKLAEALFGMSRTAADADKNADAAELLRQALETTPDDRPDWLKEYADQLTFSERAAEAIPLYERLLDDPATSGGERTELRLALARARSWAGDLDGALADYEAILAEDPDNRQARVRRAEVWQWQEKHEKAASELRRMHATDPADPDLRWRLARVESFLGNHRRAIALADSVLAERPTDTDAAIVAAESQLWMGRPDRAIATLTGYLEVSPGNARAEKLLNEIQHSLGPRTELDARRSAQSDDLDITNLGFRQSFSFGNGRTRLGPQMRLIRYDPDVGQNVDVARVGGFISHRFSDAIELNSSMYVDFQQGVRDHTILTHDTYLTLFPTDAWRIDLGINRSTLDNIKSLELGLVVDTFGASVDYWPTSNTKLTGRGSWSSYSDGNRRWLAQGEARQRIHRGPDVWVGAKATTYEFAQQLDNGYFNPEALLSVESMFEISGKLSEDTYFMTHGSAGYEKARPDAGKFIWSAGLTVSHSLNDTVTLLAHADHFSSTLASDSGFERTTVGIGVNLQW